MLLQLYAHPIITVNQVANSLSITHQAANGFIKKLVELDILTENTCFSRNRVFVFRRSGRETKKFQ